MNTHVKSCEPTLAEGDQSIAAYAHGSSYSEEMFRYGITVWVTKCHRPFAIVEDEPLQHLFRMLYDRVKIPSDTTVSRDVREVFQIAKKAVKAYLSAQKVAIHVVFDGWTAPNVLSFLGVVVAFESNGELVSILLDYVR